jgi:hypothetical protein
MHKATAVILSKMLFGLKCSRSENVENEFILNKIGQHIHLHQITSDLVTAEKTNIDYAKLWDKTSVTRKHNAAFVTRKMIILLFDF